MAKVFVVGQEGLLPLVPSYWRSYFGAKKEEKPEDSGAQKARVGSVVQAAQLIKQVPPKYAEVAKNFLFEGVVVLEAEINESGDVANLTIIKPAGAGFDESAVDAVSQWKYKPAILDGKPVPVVTTVTVNYQFAR
jgi:protein TonB